MIIHWWSSKKATCLHRKILYIKMQGFLFFCFCLSELIEELGSHRDVKIGMQVYIFTPVCTYFHTIGEFWKIC